mmetsp:Transcript_46005/g.127971  ORF Transcript_46005/g.127971 Transcript_46005/m.127971 type:complete len:237 (+) Transcript_46005:1681-2391(+)
MERPDLTGLLVVQGSLVKCCLPCCLSAVGVVTVRLVLAFLPRRVPVERPRDPACPPARRCGLRRGRALPAAAAHGFVLAGRPCGGGLRHRRVLRRPVVGREPAFLLLAARAEQPAPGPAVVLRAALQQRQAHAAGEAQVSGTVGGALEARAREARPGRLVHLGGRRELSCRSLRLAAMRSPKAASLTRGQWQPVVCWEPALLCTPAAGFLLKAQPLSSLSSRQRPSPCVSERYSGP